MKYIENTTDFYSEMPSAVTLGKFDGLHRGHQKLIRRLLQFQEEGYYGIVFTIAPMDNPVLLTAQEKKDMLEEQGIDCMIRCPYIPEILSLEPETFVSEVLIGRLKATQIVVGTDFRFGYRRSGDVQLLKDLQEKYGYKLTVMEKECYDKKPVSSSYIKESLAEADMELVSNLLGYYYPIKGEVQHGRKLGRTIGMPTINQIPDGRKLLPPEGVYYSEVIVDDRKFFGMTNIGYKPTVDGSFRGVETYLFGVNENLYEKTVEVRVRKFRRPEQRFPDVESLKAQMELDIQAGKEFFGVD